MITKIQGEQAFQVNAHFFGISQSNEGYTLAYSADAITWTMWSEATPASEDCFVSNFPFGAYFKLVGNQSEVQIIY